MEHHGHSKHGGGSLLSGRSGQSRRHGRSRGSSGRGSSGGAAGGKRRGGCLEILIFALLLLVLALVYRSGLFSKFKSSYNWDEDGDHVESPSDLPHEMPPAPEPAK